MTPLRMGVAVLTLFRMAALIDSETSRVLTGGNDPVHVAGRHDTRLLQ